MIKLFIGVTFVTALITSAAHGQNSTSFIATGSMTAPRNYHTATLLGNGKVLIAGGASTTQILNTAELFDPASGAFTTLSPNTMTSVRLGHTATLLPNGKVLIAGGKTGDTNPNSNTAELFDPATETFTSLPPMTASRERHSATLLPNGKVLIAGGFDFNGSAASDTAELFDPATGTFTSLFPNAMTSPRDNHTAILLPNGKVLLAGGFTVSAPGRTTNTAELFDPATGTFTPVLTLMTSPRYYHTATLLPTGKVLIAGGFPLGTVGAPTDTAELFDPALGIFTALPPMTSPRAGHMATLLPSGKVLIAGGGTSPVTDTAELFDPASGMFAALPPMTSARYRHTATLLPSGKVLIAGGFTASSTTTDTAELFDPATGTFTSLSPNTMSSPRQLHTATLLPSGKVLLAGGFQEGYVISNTADLFDPASGTFTLLPNTMTSKRYFHTATLLASGKVLIAGGAPGDGTILKTAELFDPVSGTFASLSPNIMTAKRFGHTATLLPNGKVLIAGGIDVNGSATAELFDPATGAFMLVPNSLTTKRYYHTSTLLANGEVLIAGGVLTIDNPGGQTTSFSNTAELFNPATGTFTSLSPNTMTSARDYHTATLLADGKVLLAGGGTLPVGFPTETAELFDAGLGFSDARRPILSTVTNPLVQPASLVLTGTGFQGDSEGSGGSFQGSATNYPLLQLMRIDNEQTFFVLSDSATNWSDTSFTSETPSNLPPGQYRVTIFTNAIPSLQKIINIGTSTAVQLSSVVSRKTHGGPNPFDIDLPLTGSPGIECRSGGASGEHTLVFKFANELTSVGGASASATQEGGGNQSVAATGSINPADRKEYIVNLSGVPNAQVLTVNLANVNDSAGNSSASVSASVGFLLGDVNQTGAVDGNDVSAVQATTRQRAVDTNFKTDVNTSGTVDGNDVSIVQGKTRTRLP